MLTKQDKRDIGEIVSDKFMEIFKDFLMPIFETLVTKQDLSHVKKRLDEMIESVQTRVDQIDRKLDIFSGKVSEHEVKLVKHDSRIERLESRRVTPV